MLSAPPRAFTEVYVYTDDWNSYAQAYTDNNGYFAVTMSIPSSEAAPGPGGISVEGNEDIRMDVAFQ